MVNPHLPPRARWSTDDFLAYNEGWSFDRLGFPAPPSESEARRASNVGAVMSSLVGGAPTPLMDRLPAETRRAMFFRLGQDESAALAAAN